MAALTATKRLNLKIEIDNVQGNVSESSDSESDVDAAAEPKRTTEQISLPLNLTVSVKNRSEIPPLPAISGPRVYDNKAAGNFVTGIDITSTENISRRTDRAKRFGIDETDQPKQIDVTSIEQYVQRTAEQLGSEVRLNVLHVRGVDEMSTKDIFEYFKEYPPSSLEWIDDTSCNVVWLDATSTARAFLALSSDRKLAKTGRISRKRFHGRIETTNTEKSTDSCGPVGDESDSPACREVPITKLYTQIQQDDTDMDKLEQSEDFDMLDLNSDNESIGDPTPRPPPVDTQTSNKIEQSTTTVPVTGEMSCDTPEPPSLVGVGDDKDDTQMEDLSMDVAPPLAKLAETDATKPGTLPGDGAVPLRPFATDIAGDQSVPTSADVSSAEVEVGSKGSGSSADDETDTVENMSIWRDAQSHKKSNRLRFRFAVKDDKKQQGAMKKSQYYIKHGNPNFGGIKGLISKSKIRKFVRAQNKGQQLDRQVVSHDRSDSESEPDVEKAAADDDNGVDIPDHIQELLDKDRQTRRMKMYSDDIIESGIRSIRDRVDVGGGAVLDVRQRIAVGQLASPKKGSDLRNRLNRKRKDRYLMEED